MLSYKCDVCKKEIKGYSDRIGVENSDPYQHFFFHQKCAQPVLNFLKKEKLLKSIKK